MLSPPDSAQSNAPEAELRAAALKRLRIGGNPFTNQVATVGNAEDSILASIPGYAANQLADLLEIINQYRTGRSTTQVYPLLGDRGAGKTHLLYVLRDTLRKRSTEAGDETLVVVVERLTSEKGAIEYLLWQIVNHFLNQTGDGGRLLNVIAVRSTARLIAESLRHLPPPQRINLFPAKGLLSRLGFGNRGRQANLYAIEKLIQICDAKLSTPEQLQAACNNAGLKPDLLVAEVRKHLQRMEPDNDVLGWFRRELYIRLAQLALLDDRGSFEEFHNTTDYTDAPANVQNAGNLGRKLLDTWLELLGFLGIPMVVVFDQLEDYLRSSNPEMEKRSWKEFTGATSQFINELRRVCILVFAEETFWTNLLTSAEPFTRERLTQPFSLAGRAAKQRVLMPDQVDPELLPQLIQKRILHDFSEIDLTGLPTAFPFGPSDLKRFAGEPSIRQCLKRMATRYDEIVFPASTSVPKPPEKIKFALHKRLDELWHQKLSAAAKKVGSKMSFSTAFIPEVQNAVQAWLECLATNDLTGGTWNKVELIAETQKGQYGYLNVIRTNGPNAPGIGVAAWLGERQGRLQDLRQRITFFRSNPCPLKTLVMLRADGESALSGESLLEYQKATAAKRDIRIHKYEPRHLHELMAFTAWHQDATVEMQTAKESDPNAEAAFRTFLSEISREWLEWVDQWRQPPVAKLQGN